MLHHARHLGRSARHDAAPGPHLRHHALQHTGRLCYHEPVRRYVRNDAARGEESHGLKK